LMRITRQNHSRFAMYLEIHNYPSATWKDFVEA